ncbi:Uncharacterised protein [Clostridioides difficile]|nr:Uncharacterised protein [Clostridioides difficile]
MSDVCAARLPISEATTANPFPCSPARAASIEALSDNKLTCSAISEIALAIAPIFSTILAFSMLCFRFVS